MPFNAFSLRLLTLYLILSSFTTCENQKKMFLENFNVAITTDPLCF